MHYRSWRAEHYPYLYELFFHVIVPYREKVKKNASEVSFEEFCQISYQRHGFGRMV